MGILAAEAAEAVGAREWSWRMPHHRIGAILFASQSEDGSDELALGVDRAAAVSRRMLESGRFREYTNELYERVAGNLNMDVRIGAEAPVLSFGPGRIIDFPRFWLRSAKLGWVQVRVCITICLHESQSKVWVRYLAHCDPLSMDSARGYLTEFLAQSETVTGHMMNGLIPLYREDMRKAAAVDSVDVGIKNVLQFISVDTAAPDIDDFADLVRFGSARTALRAPWQSADEFRGMLEIVAPDQLSAPLPPRLIQHTTSRGRTGIFAQFVRGPRIVHVGIGSLAEDEKSARINQTKPAPRDNPETGQGDRISGSMQVTAELANAIARDY